MWAYSEWTAEVALARNYFELVQKLPQHGNMRENALEAL